MYALYNKFESLIPYTVFFIALITICIPLKRKSGIDKFFGYLTCILYICSAWNFTKNNIIFFSVTVFILCIYIDFIINQGIITYKKVIIFLNNIFIVIWETILFGKSYFENNIDTLKNFTYEINKYYKPNTFFVNIHLYSIFFKWSLPYYFEFSSQSFICQVQFILGLIFAGTLISPLFDFIKSITLTE